MTFEHLIAQTCLSAKNNILTDGVLTCTYQEIAAVFASCDQFFARNKLSLSSPLALEGNNTVPSALTLLYLLSRGYSFFLFPPSHENNIHPPQFCQYRLVVNNSTSLLEPGHYAEHYLTVEKNEEFHYVPSEKTKRRLYLRTSGSMGNAKIVVHVQDRLLGNVLNCVKRFQLGHGDKVALPVPIFHMYGLGAAFLPAMIAGSSIDLQYKSNLLRYLERERQFDPNIAFLTPSLCEMLVKGRRTSKTYKLVVTAGDRIKEETFRTFNKGCGRLVNLYGSTEMGAVAVAHATDSLDIRTNTIGRPMEGVHLRVKELNPKSEVPTGELYCQHQHGFECYIDAEGKLISPAPQWYKTGDLATIHSSGYVQILGRNDNSINRSGYLVRLADIEKAIERIEKIEQVVVLAVQGESVRGQRMVAFCVPRPGNTLDGTKIREACFNFLPNYAIPEQVQVVDTLPTLPSGKIDRQTLRTMANERR